MHVKGSAQVTGNLDARNTVAIGGVLHLGRALDANASKNVTASSIVQDAATVVSPLACSHAPDLGALLASASGAGNALASVKEPTDVTLGCGSYSLSSLGIDNTLAMHVEGHTTIVVKGDVRIAAPMRIELAAGASLDLLIGGSLDVANTLSITSAGDLGVDTGAWVA